MKTTIRTRIENVNTLSHYAMANNAGMKFREWLDDTMGKMSPSELSRLSGVPQPTIFRILKGETKDPRLDTVKKLERALGVSSPPLEAEPPNESHSELIEAWDYLLPSQQQEMLDRIKAYAKQNAEAAARFKPKVVRVVDRRKRQVSFDGPDRRNTGHKDDSEQVD